MTDLIQRFMYTYLYYEAAHLNSLQSDMVRNMIVLMGAVVSSRWCFCFSC